jgi:hypothetical protein
MDGVSRFRWLLQSYQIIEFKGALVVVYFAIFCALAICIGWLVAKIYEWRLNVLYGRYVGPGRPTRKR